MRVMQCLCADQGRVSPISGARTQAKPAIVAGLVKCKRVSRPRPSHESPTKRAQRGRELRRLRLEARYAKAANKPFEEKGDGLEGEARKAFAASLRETFTKFGPTMAKGGNDAFVPAFFRAELLKRFNAQMKGKVQAYATMRDSELINADWSVDKVMKGSPFVSEVNGLMKTGGLAAVSKRQGDRLMVYTPMKLGAACVSCHARNGINQKEGDFGGALVAEVWIK